MCNMEIWSAWIIELHVTIKKENLKSSSFYVILLVGHGGDAYPEGVLNLNLYLVCVDLITNYL